MFKISDIKIGSRLALGFGLVLFFALAMLTLGLWRMSQLQRATDNIVNDNVASMTAAVDMREAGWTVLLTLRHIATPTDALEAERETKRLDQMLADYAKSEQNLSSLLVDEGRKNVFNASVEQKQAILPIIQKIKALVETGDYFNATVMLQNEFLPVHGKWMQSLGALANAQQGEMKSTYEASQAKYAGTRNWMIGVGFIMLASGAFFGWKITRTITEPLQFAAEIADKIANGDLTGTVNADSKDEAGQLINSLKTMQGNLISIVNHIQQGAETIGIASSEIASGNADLSARTESQASSLEQTSASMEELTETVRQNAENAQQANQLVMSASTFAVKGGTVVGEVVNTMGSIKASSSKIVDIIGVIDGIAFQTNILALNAAVEAARAGEQGRGFAVVAAEVRTLAQRSANAAKEIKALITDSVQTVDAGGKLVDEAGKTMSQIVTSVQRVADIMSEITAASQEQRAGIGEVNQAVAQMDELTQQNAALVEQAAAAAESMQEQTVALKEAVSVFKLNQGAQRYQALGSNSNSNVRSLTY